MKCKCGADMNHQSQGVYFCTRGDMFLVIVPHQWTQGEQWTALYQWYSMWGQPEKVKHDGASVFRNPISR